MNLDINKATSTYKLLCVDDDQDLLRLMQIKLASSGFELEFAHSCQEARNLFSAKPYDAVLIDYTLSDGDGIELLKDFVVKKPHGAYIIMTGNSDEKVALTALNAGACYSFVKDISGAYFSLLPAVVKQAVAASREFERGERSKIFLTNELLPSLNSLAEIVEKGLTKGNGEVLRELSVKMKSILKSVDEQLQ